MDGAVVILPWLTAVQEGAPTLTCSAAPQWASGGCPLYTDGFKAVGQPRVLLLL